MNCLYRLKFVLVFIVIAAAACRQPVSRVDKNEAIENEQDGIEEAMLQEIKMTSDPALGYIPNERLFEARKVAESRAAVNRTASGLIWSERGPTNVGGRTRAILVDKNDPTGNTIFAGSAGGGIWKCTDFKSANYTWTRVNDNLENLAISVIAQDPTSPNIMYAGTGEGFGNADAIRGAGIFQSLDGGSNWSRLASTAPTFANDYTYIQDIVVTAAGQIYAACRSTVYCNNGGIMKSTDQGASWTRVIGTYNSSGSCADALYFRGNDLEIAANGDLYATTGLSGSSNATYGHVFKSPATLGSAQGDAGQWTEITPTPPTGESGFRRIELACAPSSSSRVYLLCQKYNDYSVTKFYRSNNGGTSWTAINVPSWCDQGTIKTDFTRGQAWYDLIAAFDPANASKLLIGGVDVMSSSDGGSTFSQLTRWSPGTACGASLSQIHADIHNIIFMNGTSGNIIISNDGGLFYSADGGVTFTGKNNGYNVTQFYAVAIHPDAGSSYLLAGAQDNGSHKFVNAGLGASTTVTGGDGAYCFIDQVDPNIQITSYVYCNYYISRNGGGFFNYNLSNSNGDFVNPSEYDSKSKLLYCGYGLGVMGRVKNIASGTPAVDQMAISNISSQYVSTLKVDPNTDNRLYIGAYSGQVKIVRIDNANAVTPTYTTLGFPAVSGYISSIDVEDGNANHLLATLSNYGVISVYESIDGGAIWSNIEGDLPDMPVRWGLFIPGSNARIALATELGVWTTATPIGSTPSWSPDNNGMANVKTNMIRFRKSDSTLAIATHGRGTFTTSLAVLPVRLAGFTGYLQGDNAMLQWKTASESNTSVFEIERSYAGSEYKKVGTVIAAGNSSTLRSYSFYDREIAHAANYYRLKMVDKDGSSVYSNIVLLKSSNINQKATVLNNPFRDYIDVRFDKVPAGKVVLQLVNMNGSTFKTQSYSSVSQSIIRFAIGSKAISAGTYVLTIFADGEKISKKVLKQ